MRKNMKESRSPIVIPILLGGVRNFLREEKVKIIKIDI